MDKQTRESIEACRPASDDLQQPDMADVARRVEIDPEARVTRQRTDAWDTAISKAIEEVAVPPGLAERILSRLSAAQQNPELLAGATAQVYESGASPDAHVSPARHAWARRHWAGAALAVAAAGLVVALGIQVWRPAADADFDVLADEWQDELGTDWLPMAKAPSDFPIPESVLATPAHWQQIGDFTTARVVAYELVKANAKAMLYVTRMTRNGLPAGPPPRPQKDTGGRAVAWWKSGDFVYVLVLENVDDYGKFVRPSTHRLA